MKKKTLKMLSFVLITICSFFIGANVVSARTQLSSKFYYDYTFKLRLGTTLTQNSNGDYEVDVVGYTTTDFDETVDLSDSDAIHYLVTEIDEDTYNTLKEYQDAIDELDLTVLANDSSAYKDNESIAYIQSAVDDNAWWCYNKYTAGTVTIPADCDTHYYVVTVDAGNEDVADSATSYSSVWNYHTARVYKVEANETSCPSTTTTTEEEEEENPSTGISTPYVVGAIVIAGGILVVVVSKKKKYI